MIIFLPYMNVVKLQCKKEKNVDDDTWVSKLSTKRRKKKEEESACLWLHIEF